MKGTRNELTATTSSGPADKTSANAKLLEKPLTQLPVASHYNATINLIQLTTELKARVDQIPWQYVYNPIAKGTPQTAS